MRDGISDVKSTMGVQSAKIQQPRENLYINKKLAVQSVNQRLCLNYVIWLIWNIVSNLCSVCLSRKISYQKEEEKE